MELGLTKDEVKIVPYNAEWKNEFDRIKVAILQTTNINDNQIEHIGSTAIVEMKAKPIIDILVGVKEISEINRDFEQALRSIGFYRLRVARPNEVVFAKFKDETFEIKTHFIHVVNFKDDLWENLLFFRNYLNEHEDAKLEYIQLKEAYLETRATGINDYTNFKEDFVMRIFSKRILGVSE
ncbi:GrpB family protein [Solibacillus sp. CAU 1738]|uniref:GrpB family protein n=1 Tax=Solibacillus sp. CAU 1738 TaxID=3140363 RepID=UPI0032614730